MQEKDLKIQSENKDSMSTFENNAVLMQLNYIIGSFKEFKDEVKTMFKEFKDELKNNYTSKEIYSTEYKNIKEIVDTHSKLLNTYNLENMCKSVKNLQDILTRVMWIIITAVLAAILGVVITNPTMFK
jgi:hypothetical protein